MKLKDVINQKSSELYTVDVKAKVKEAVNLLNEKHIGVLLVVDTNGDLYGLISERDILSKCIDASKGLDKIKVSDVMTPAEKIVIGSPEDTLDYAMNVMTQDKHRHLPIMENDKLLGIISIGDVVKSILEEQTKETELLREYIKNPYGVPEI